MPNLTNTGIEGKEKVGISSESSVSIQKLQSIELDPRRNLIHEIEAEPFQVHLKIRPLTNQEKQKNDVEFRHVIEKDSLKVTTPVGLVHEFKFTKVFDGKSNQTEVFDGTTLYAVKDFIDGQNYIVFSYGVTNSGKTYTMQGSPTNPGIIPRALEMLFRNISHRLCPTLTLKPQNGSIVPVSRIEAIAEKQIKDEVFKMGSNDPDAMQSIFMESINASVMKHSTFIDSSTISDDSLEKMPSFRSTMDFVDDDFFCIFVSYVEVYNEKVYDLLAPIKGSSRPALNLQENRNVNLFAKGVREICVNSVDDALKLLVVGQQNLKVASTKLNYSSSRSHSVYTIKVLRTADILDPNSVKSSQLCFCDLAGSERYLNTQNVGERLKEASLINTSLLVLGRCITALRHNQLYPKEPSLPIPFRESKLTRIFQGFFTGKGKALMIVNISPCERVINETYHVLRFSALAKEIVLPQNLECLTSISKITKLSLDLIRRSINGKESIDWESPETSSAKTASLENYNDHALHQGSKLEATIDEGDESYVQDTDDDDNANEIILKYWGIIQTLREKLIQEHKEKAEIEMKVRDEMGDNVLEVLAANEEHFSKRLSEQKEKMLEFTSKRLQHTTDYYEPLIAFAKQETDELKEKIISLETVLNSLKAEKQIARSEKENVILEKENVISEKENVISEKEKLISDLESKNKVLELANSEAEKTIEKQQKEMLQMKIQLKHASRETQSSLYFSMLNTGSSSSEGSNKQEYGNATVYGSPCGGDITKSTSDDVFFKSPLPKTSKIERENVETLSTSVIEDVSRDQSVMSDSGSSLADMSMDGQDKSESKLEDSIEGGMIDDNQDSEEDEEKQETDIVELHSRSQQTDLHGKEISLTEREQDKLEENVSDLEEVITKLECKNGLLEADVSHSKMTVERLKEQVSQLESRLRDFSAKSVVDVSSQTDLTGELIVATDENLSKAEKTNKENTHEMRLMARREKELNKEMEKISLALAAHDELLQTYQNEKKDLKDKLIAENSKCNGLQLQLDKLKETSQQRKNILSITTVSESDFETNQPPPSRVKPKKSAKKKTLPKEVIYVDDTDSSDGNMALRSRSKTATKRTKRGEEKVDKQEEEEESDKKKRSLRHKVKMPNPCQMLTSTPISPKKEKAKDANTDVHKQVMRRLRARK